MSCNSTGHCSFCLRKVHKREFASLRRRWSSFHSPSNSHCPAHAQRAQPLSGDRAQACGHPSPPDGQIQWPLSAAGFGQPEARATAEPWGICPAQAGNSREAQLQPAACTAAGNNAPSLHSLPLGACSSLAPAAQEGKHFLTFVLRVCWCWSSVSPAEEPCPPRQVSANSCGMWAGTAPEGKPQGSSSGLRGVGEKR